MVIGASFDGPIENNKFREKFDFPFDLLSDEDKSVAISYGVIESTEAKYPKRVSFLIDTNGKIAAIYEKVTPAEHPAEVLRDLEK